MTRAHQLGRGALALAVTTAAGCVFAASGASAASCSAIDISAGRNLTFNVSSVYVAKGGCVRFANLTDVTVTVTVSGSSYSERLPARTPATASKPYTANKSAGVTATDGVRTGHGRINVQSGGATATPTATQSAVVPSPSKSTTPTVTPKPSSSTSKQFHDSPLPNGAATDAAAAVNTQHPFALPAFPSVPPVQGSGGGSSGGGPPTASHPVVAPQIRSSDPRFTSTVLEPAHGPRRGLPAMVAAVLLVGLAVAYGRTVLVAGAAVERRPVPRAVRHTV